MGDFIKGDWVEVSNDGQSWCARVYNYTNDGQYYCFANKHLLDDECWKWDFIRSMKDKQVLDFNFDEVILVKWDKRDSIWLPRHFKSWQGNGDKLMAICFIEGKSSKTIEDTLPSNSTRHWKMFKKYDDNIKTKIGV